MFVVREVEWGGDVDGTGPEDKEYGDRACAILVVNGVE
jgi:hypothetical protein